MREGTFSNALFHLKFKERVLGVCGGGGKLFSVRCYELLTFETKVGGVEFSFV